MLMASTAKGAAEVGGTDWRSEGHPRGKQGLGSCGLGGSIVGILCIPCATNVQACPPALSP